MILITGNPPCHTSPAWLQGLYLSAFRFCSRAWRRYLVGSTVTSTMRPVPDRHFTHTVPSTRPAKPSSTCSSSDTRNSPSQRNTWLSSERYTWIRLSLAGKGRIVQSRRPCFCYNPLSFEAGVTLAVANHPRNHIFYWPAWSTESLCLVSFKVGGSTGLKLNLMNANDLLAF